MSKKVTMQQIADYLGVSKFVVSKALSGKEGVSDTTRERVIQAAAQLGYFTQKNAYMKQTRPDRSGAQSSKPIRQSVLVLMPNIRFQTKDSLYWGRILDGIAARLEEDGYGMVIVSEQSADRFAHFLNPDGILGLIGVGEISTTLLLEAHRIGMPMVLVDHEDALIPTDTVFANNYESMYRLTKHLIGIGHRRLSFVGAIRYSRSFHDRFLGFRSALEEAGLRKLGDDGALHGSGMSMADGGVWIGSNASATDGGTRTGSGASATDDGIRTGSGSQAAGDVRDEWLLEVEGLEGRFEEPIRQWLRRLDRAKSLPTALVCANDIIAIGAVDALRSLGRSVPEDVSVTGFDNIDDAHRLTPALTTVHVPKESLGKRAVERLLERIAAQDEPLEKTLLSGELLYRGTTAGKAQGS